MLLEILVCPQDKGELRYVEAENVLVNDRLGIAYPIEDGIPVMLKDSAVVWRAVGTSGASASESDNNAATE